MPSAVPLLQTLPVWGALSVQLLVGRTLLSLLPPGRPGGHLPGELFATFGASHALGAVALGAEALWLGAAGWAPSPALALLPWGLFLAGRLASLPGAARPRIDPPELPAGWPGLAAHAVIALALFAVLAREGARPAADLAAICALALEGLRTQRVPRAQRAAWVALFAGAEALSLLPPPTPSATLAALAATGGVAWVRRADRRGLDLGGAGALGLVSRPPCGPLLAPLAALALIGVTPSASRKRAAIHLGVAGLFILAPLPWTAISLPSEGGAGPAARYSPLLLPLAGAALRIAAGRGKRASLPRRELYWLGLLAASLGLAAEDAAGAAAVLAPLALVAGGGLAAGRPAR